jgi:hypothetical protein
MSGMELQMTDLAKYLAGKLDERNLSVRAFAMYAKLSHTTIREILLRFPSLRVWSSYCRRCGATYKTTHNRINPRCQWRERQSQW